MRPHLARSTCSQLQESVVYNDGCPLNCVTKDLFKHQRQTAQPHAGKIKYNEHNMLDNYANIILITTKLAVD